MLAVSSCGDILLFVKDKKNPQLLKLVRLAAMSVYKEGTTSTSLEACWLEDALKGPTTTPELGGPGQAGLGGLEQQAAVGNQWQQQQLDLVSKEVKVLAAAFPHPSARLFSGPGALAALLVGDTQKGPAGSSLYSCSAEGELQLLRSGLTVAHDMLAVNKAGDVLFFQPHPDNKALLSLVCIRVEGGGAGQAGLGGLEQQAAAASEVAGQRAREHWDAVGPVQPALRSAVAAAERAAAAAQAARTRFVVIALITECNSNGGATVVASRNGKAFRKLFKLEYEPSGFTVDGEGRIWLAQKNVVKRYTAEGNIIRGEGFRIPPMDTVSAAPEAVVTALHRLGDKLYILRKSGSRQTTDGQTREQSVLMEYDMVDGSLNVVAEHLAADCRIAVFPCGRVLFISISRSLCQLDLGSKEVEVLVSAFPHPSARLFPGESGGALLVPGWWGRSQVHSCSSEGELTRHTRWFWGLPVVDSMLAVSSSGDILFWVKDKKNPQLLKLARLPALSVYKKGATATSLEACWLEDALNWIWHWLLKAGRPLLVP
ncbi:hypothetical protein V8C86DRAFT_3198251 [Haematococcus lacustris]